MKPVIIFRHAAAEGPGYFATVLEAQGIPWQLVRIDEGETLPNSVSGFGGMVLMGGPMSVNDDLQWIPPLLDLIQEAVALDIPLLGHCLGGQLISKALGAVVTKNAVKEIGWGDVSVSNHDVARFWFGDVTGFNGFHWHGETFSLPEGAVHLLKSDYCYHQAYALGKHLAFQCHIEMTVEMVKGWCEVGIDELNQAPNSPAVQQPETMMRDLESNCLNLNQVAEHVYMQWIRGLVP